MNNKLRQATNAVRGAALIAAAYTLAAIIFAVVVVCDAFKEMTSALKEKTHPGRNFKKKEKKK